MGANPFTTGLVDPAGYGSAGAQAFLGLQQEMLRRAELQRMDEQTVYERQRQAAQDDLQRKRVEAELAIQQDNLATNKEVREANAGAAKERARKSQADELLKTLKPGDVDADTFKKASDLGLGHLFLATPTDAVPAKAESSDFEGQPASPEVPAGTKYTFSGTADQQDKETRRQHMEAVARGDYDTGDENVDKWLHAQALTELATGKSASIPAPVITGPKTAAESKGQRDLKLEDIMAKPKEQWTPEEQALVAGRKAFNDEQQRNANQRVQVNVTAGDKRADDRYRQQAERSFTADLTRDRKPIRDSYERAERAVTSLKHKTAAEDAVAIPEFLSVEAGGMGSGLRMTDAEIRKVQTAQTLIRDWEAKLSRVGIVPGMDQFLLGPELRQQMLDAVALVSKKAKARLKVVEDTQRKLKDAPTADDIYNMKADYWGDELAAGESPDDAAAGAPPSMTPSHAPAGVSPRVKGKF